MPIIELFVNEGALDESAKQMLHERLPRRVLEAEGADYRSPLARSITWLMIHELPDGSWSTGSDVCAADSPRVLTRVTVPVGAVEGEKRSAIAAGVHEELVDVLGEEVADPTKNVCLIAQEDFGAGGHVIDYQQLTALLTQNSNGDADGTKPTRADGLAPLGRQVHGG